MIPVALLVSLASVGRTDLTSEVESLVANWNREDSPGGVVAVLERGRPACVLAFGMADPEQARANTPATPFYIASLAKMFTGACAVHAGLDLEASCLDVLPELPEIYRPATVRHLLQHRSGIPDLYDTVIAADLGLESIASNRAGIELIAKMTGSLFPAGERMAYSNSGYVLVAEAIRRKTGKDLASYAREHVFEPLGMTGSCFADAAPPLAARSGAILTGLQGPGGMYASLDDMIRWERAWQEDEWADAELRKEILTTAEGWQHPVFGAYAAGIMRQHVHGLPAERHSGGAFGFSSDFLRFPEQGITVIVLSNASDLSADDLASSVAQIVLRDAISNARSDPAESEEWTGEQARRFAGLWRRPGTDDVWILTPMPDSFRLVALQDIRLHLVAESESRLVARDAQQPFAVELDGARLVVVYPAGERVALERVDFPPAEPAPLDEVVGEYRCAVFGSTIHLGSTAGRLVFEQSSPVIELPPFLWVGDDTFVCDAGAVLTLHRNDAREVVGVRMRGNRSAGIDFVR